MAYVSWEDFMKGRAAQSVYCFGVQWPEWPIKSLLIKKGAKPATPYQHLKAWLAETCHGDWSVTSIPATVSMLIHTAFAIVNLIWVGRLGPEPIAAVISATNGSTVAATDSVNAAFSF